MSRWPDVEIVDLGQRGCGVVIASTAGDWASIGVTAFLGVAALVAGRGIIRDVQLRVVDRRLAAYERLWALMRVVSQTEEPLGEHGRAGLHRRLTDWYFAHGDGLVLADATRSMFLTARDNLLCDPTEVVPPVVASGLVEVAPADLDRARGELARRQLSLLRTQMKSDLAVFGTTYGTGLDAADRAFLEACHVDLTRRPWRQ